ncbi:Serine/threonine-protein kinase PrkC [Botrimarina colliarenosi]|uniref:Serine/threonine-protein kinase PrkC n=1 Tax=Botrimarina colliarenosi TaxID=2528001 RepID=A0A5C6AN64_9BACT|nr:serine/threonine-protein kinase [Botrimarina colliarenosi]TWU00452.1 Serine/threonine-protein kinase PrkC [Botrimarina colliarenosi]
MQTTTEVAAAKALDAIRGNDDLGLLIGRGGMGAVYRIVEPDSGAVFAVKTIRNDLFAGDAEAMLRFERESTLLGRLHHPNIVRHYGGRYEGDIWLFLMDYIEGVSLRDLIREASGESGSEGSLRQLATTIAESRGGHTVSASADYVEVRNGALSTDSLALRPGYVRDACLLICQIGEALQYAHNAGVVHRDVKPANIILASSGESYLVDFGLARSIDDTSLTPELVPLGTWQYMSWEQAANARHVDHRTDIYSLGLTLYELLALRRPFTAQTSGEMMKAILQDPIPPLEPLNPTVGKSIASVVHKATSKAAESRYQTMQGFVDDLRAAVDGGSVAARPYRFQRNEREVVVSRPWGVAFVTLLVYLVSTGSVALAIETIAVAPGPLPIVLGAAFLPLACGFSGYYIGWRLLRGSAWARRLVVALAWTFVFLQAVVTWATFYAPDDPAFRNRGALALGSLAFFGLTSVVTLYLLVLNPSIARWFRHCRDERDRYSRVRRGEMPS